MYFILIWFMNLGLFPQISKKEKKRKKKKQKKPTIWFTMYPTLYPTIPCRSGGGAFVVATNSMRTLFQGLGAAEDMNVIKVTAAGSKVMIKIKMGRHPEIKAKHKINIMCDGYASQH